MKRIGCLIVLILVVNYAFTQSKEFECVSCKGNQINFENLASGIGEKNIATGKYSFVGGTKSYALSNYSFAFGLEAKSEGLSSFALGNTAQSLGMYSLAIGRGSVAAGDASFALGYKNLAQAEASYLFGDFLKSTASSSVTIGIGAGTGGNYLKNNKGYSLMVGFNSIYPTLFVNSGSGIYKTGKVGIGNITTPTAKLHILGDNDPANANDASLFIQSAGNYYSSIFLGDMEHSIISKPAADITFHTSTGNSFKFENGNVGIGTSESPAEKLEVNGNIYQPPGFNISTNQINAPDVNGLSLTDQSNNGIYVKDGGNVGIGTNTPMYNLCVEDTPESQNWLVDIHNERTANAIYGVRLKFETDDDPGNNDKFFTIEGVSATHFIVNGDGKVGIGTNNPGAYKLAVAGDVLAEEVIILHADNWYDYVFEDDYNLPSLSDLENYIKQNKHLPDVPSEKEVHENGINIGDMNGILLKKVEELTLYVIEQQKEIEKLQLQINKIINDE